MNWFKRIFVGHGMAVCPVCHVYCDPRRHYTFADDRFREYCDTHRREKIAEQDEKDELARWLKDHKEEIAFFRANVNTQRMRWLVQNWPKFEKQYSEEEATCSGWVWYRGGGPVEILDKKKSPKKAR